MLSKGILAMSVLLGGLWALHLAEAQVLKHTLLVPQVTYEFANAPDYLLPELNDEVSSLANRAWQEETLCQEVYALLQRNGWIRNIMVINKFQKGRVRIECEFRHPVALVQIGEYYYLIDEYGVRLPGRYGFDPGWMLIQGIRESPPAAGTHWPGKDVNAAVRLANMILTKPYYGQISTIQVHNYGGREDPHRCHVVLLSDRADSRILWGSAPGEELEENSVGQKLQILGHNYMRYGRVDANHREIDISVFPDRFLVPT